MDKTPFNGHTLGVNLIYVSICSYTNRLLSCCGRVGAEFCLSMNFLVKGQCGQCVFQVLCSCTSSNLFVQRFPSGSKTCILCVLPFIIWFCVFLLSSSVYAKSEIIVTKVIVTQLFVLYIIFNLLRRTLKFQTILAIG